MAESILVESNQVNATNPFFLHHSDNPGLVLVSKPLIGENYSSWHRAMLKSLNAKNKLGFVDGTIVIPSSEEDPDHYASWSRCNDMVHSWIINSLAADITDSVIYYSTAREVWEDLRERFSQSNAPRIYDIQRDIAYLRQEQLSVAAYYSKLKSLCDELASYSELCHCGAQQDLQKLMQFLMGLNDSYSDVRGQVLLMNPLPSVRQAYSSISGKERQRNLSQTNFQQPMEVVASAMAIRRPMARKLDQNNQQSRVNDYRIEFNKGDSNHMRSSNNQRPHCTHCDKPGHYVDTCYQLHGFPSGHSRAKVTKFRGAGNVTTTNQVSEVGGDISSTISALSEAQMQQILAILNSKSRLSTSPQAHAISTPGSGYEEDDWFG